VLSAENDSLRLLLEQAGIDARALLAHAGIDAKEREAANRQANETPPTGSALLRFAGHDPNNLIGQPAEVTVQPVIWPLDCTILEQIPL
jgi:hypothetical protein